MSAGRLLGIEVRIHWSLILIFALVVFDLGAGVFPVWHPEWGLALIWVTALAAAVLFFASILAHELSHSVVARRFGVDVRRITLFMFGGISHMEEDPPSPLSEFTIAIVGPLTSIVIGIAALAVALLEIGPVSVEVFRNADPLPSLLLWLGPVNVVLGIFNLAPGYPLDGGRVFRSVVWWLTGDVLRATRWAAMAGSLLAWALMALGVFSALDGMVIGGLWLLLIGWFLLQMANLGYRQQVIQSSLEGVPVSKIMKTDLIPVPPTTTLATFIKDYVLVRDQSAYPVVEDGDWIGIVSIEALKKVPPRERSGTTVASVMVRKDELATIQSDASAIDAFRHFPDANGVGMPVLDHGRFKGLVNRQDFARWVSLRAA